MGSTIILKEWTKNTQLGTHCKRQPLHPADKFERLLKAQKTAYTKTIKRYFEMEHLDIKVTSRGSWQGDRSPMFSEMTLPETKCIVFNY